MAREKFTERIATITDTDDTGRRTYSPVERGSVRDTGFRLVVQMAGGAKARPERTLAKKTEAWRGFRIHGHKRVAGQTWATIACPEQLLAALCEFSFVVRVVQRERGAAGASAGAAPLPKRR